MSNLIENINLLKTTELGVQRIKKKFRFKQ